MQINKDQVEKFIKRVFCYYNGRINIFNNPAELRIDWVDNVTNLMGGTMPPNIVIIYPTMILRGVKNDSWMFHYYLVETIIHELYHADQVLNYVNYLTNEGYRNYIEYAVEVMTKTYISNHINEIAENFGICINMSPSVASERLNTLYGFVATTSYHRLNLYRYLVNILEQMKLYNSDHTFEDIFSISTMIEYNLNNNVGSITFSAINDFNHLPDLKVQYDATDQAFMQYMNQWLYDNYFKYNYKPKMYVSADTRNNITIKLIGNGSYAMASLVHKD